MDISSQRRSVNREKLSSSKKAGLQDYEKVLRSHSSLRKDEPDPMEKYRVTSKIGEGAYGEVYMATNRQNGEKVALKIIKLIRSFQTDNGISLDLVREIKILTSLRHLDNIVILNETFFSKEGDIVMAFEYMDADLSGLLTLGDINFKEEHVKCLLLQTMRAVKSLHDNSLMHRDCKTSNLLVNSATGIVKLADFGLATNYKQRSRFSCNVVTLWYRAPELLLLDEVYGPAVDIWAVGCIFFELVNKRCMFKGRDEKTQLDVILRVIGTPSEETWPGVTSLPLWQLAANSTYHRSLPAMLENNNITGEAASLITKLLQPNPVDRITIDEALSHPYFTQPPLCNPADLPKFPNIHEYEAKNKRKRDGT